MQRVGGAPDRIKDILLNPANKHIFLTRDIEASVRSLTVTMHKSGLCATGAAHFDAGWIQMGFDPDDIDDILAFTGMKEFTNLLRYHADVLKMDNYALLNIEDVWDNPEGTMRALAQFLVEVPWTEDFLHWEGIAFPVTPELYPFFKVVNETTGFMKRTEGTAGMTKTSEIGVRV
eukprot:m.68361 g.68361  ORF g.68361 m.68361 type:complete len:175 (-) comp23946_c0_seq3:516-1040(-)